MHVGNWIHEKMSDAGQGVMRARRQLSHGDATPSSRYQALHATRASRVHETGGLALRLLTSLPARFLLGLIWLYRHTLSPALPVVLGPGCGCRFHPTCAVFAAESVRAHGAVAGSWLAVRRQIGRAHV